jgi:hyaluronoglucosaminidase
VSGGTSPFAVRGVIEGFYGRPWNHDQRLDMIRFIGRHGMNTFAYAPKDDPLLRREWRTRYTGADLERLRELVSTARSNGVDFLFCLSPGLSIRYSSADDRTALLAKLDSVAALGVDFFGLLVDDIPMELQHQPDRDAYADLADAHVSLIGHVFDHLGPNRRLVVCPTVYCGRGDEDYIRRLGAGMDPRVDLFWTGRAIVSPTLDLLDAAIFMRATNRPPTYWDNYPVNDVAMTHELHIGPYRGRDPHLHRFATGVIANAMERVESSKIAIATIADYLRDPEAYEPEASWQRAIREVAGEADAEAFRLFADNVRSSALDQEDAPLVTAAIAAFRFQAAYGDRARAAGELTATAARLARAADHLLRGQPRNAALVAEARPWIESFEVGAQALRCMAQLAAEDRLAADAAAELRPYLDRLRGARRRVFGDVLDMTLDELISDGGGLT